MRKSLIAVWRDAVGDSDLDSSAKLVGYAISTWMNGRGTCYPSRRSIAARSSVSDRTVDAAVERLEHDGWLAVSRSDGGRGRTNGYAALLPETAKELRRSEWERAKLTTRNSEADDIKGEGASPESVLKRVKAAGGAHLEGSPPPLGECVDCGREEPLVDREALRCAACLAKRAAA